MWVRRCAFKTSLSFLHLLRALSSLHMSLDFQYKQYFLPPRATEILFLRNSWYGKEKVIWKDRIYEHVKSQCSGITKGWKQFSCACAKLEIPVNRTIMCVWFLFHLKLRCNWESTWRWRLITQAMICCRKSYTLSQRKCVLVFSMYFNLCDVIGFLEM